MWGGIASAVGSVVGGVLGLRGQRESAANAENLNQLNYANQKEFAQNGIRWKVADAKAAGLHPLAALGASTAQYTPATAIGDSPDWSFLADAGQSIGRAVDAKRTQQERVEQQQKQDAAFALKAENQKAENDLIRAQTASIKQDMALRLAKASEQAVRTQQQVPAMPSLADAPTIAGQAQAYPVSRTQMKVPEVLASEKGRPSVEAGLHPDTARVTSVGGGHVAVPSDKNADVAQDNIFLQAQWFLRNGVVPYFSQFIPGYTDPRAPALTKEQRRQGYNDHILRFTGEYSPTRRWFRPRDGWSW